MLVHPMALLPGGAGAAMLVRRSQYVFRYYLQAADVDTVCELDRLGYQRDGPSQPAGGREIAEA